MFMECSLYYYVIFVLITLRENDLHSPNYVICTYVFVAFKSFSNHDKKTGHS